MSDTVRFGDGQKLPKANKPIPVARLVLRILDKLSGIGKVSPGRPVSVRSGNSWLSVTKVCKDGVLVQVRGNRRIQNLFIKCKNPDDVKVAIEKEWATHHNPSHLRRRTA